MMAYEIGFIVLGCVQLFCGIANLALGIANAVVCGFLGSIGYGIWGSVLCFAAGVSGLVAGCGHSSARVLTHMVLSVIAAVSATVQLAMSVNSAVVDYDTEKKVGGWWSFFPNQISYTSQWNFFATYGCSGDQRDMYATRGGGIDGPTTTDALLASFAIIQGIVAVIAAVLACRATVCKPDDDLLPWEKA